MPRKKILTTLMFLAALAASGTLATLPAAAAAPATPAAAPSDAVVHPTTESSAAVTEYWTKERMAAAREATVAAPRAAADREAVPASRLGPRSAPGSGPVAPGTAPAGARGPATTIAKSAVWAKHGTKPATTIGKLYFTTADGGAECTAAVINSQNHSMIWTASHCVDDGEGHWYSKFQFVPDYHDGVQPLGVWVSKSVATTTEYLHDADVDYDFAAITLKLRNGVKVGDATGWQGYHFNGGLDWNATEFGYPYDTHPARAGITGQQLRYCVGQTGQYALFDPLEAIHCDMGHGASGGPWLDSFQSGRGWGYLVGNVSRHYDDSSDVEVSPVLGDAAINVYNRETNA